MNRLLFPKSLNLFRSIVSAAANSLEELTIPKSVELIDSDSIPSSVENVTIKSTGETSESLVVKSANTSAKYRVATESVKAKLVEYGVPESEHNS